MSSFSDSDSDETNIGSPIKEEINIHQTLIRTPRKRRLPEYLQESVVDYQVSRTRGRPTLPSSGNIIIILCMSLIFLFCHYNRKNQSGL